MAEPRDRKAEYLAGLEKELARTAPEQRAQVEKEIARVKAELRSATTTRATSAEKLHRRIGGNQ